MNTKQPFAIISSDHIHILQDTLLALNMPFKKVLGVYKGKHEESLVVPLKTWQESLLVKELGLAHKQESILLVDSNGVASLEYMSDYRSEVLGSFVCVSKEYALERDSYTVDNDKYYVAG